jgi:1,4-dihydroxy-2-naphthoyl-CoA hydrolase
MSAEPRVSNFDELYGLEFLEVSADKVRARVVVEDHHKQPFGLVHGGVYAAIAESTASVGTFVGVKDDGKISMGMNNNTTFLRPLTEGTVHAVATPVHRGRTTWVWDVEITNDEGKPVALTRMTIAVRDAR